MKLVSYQAQSNPESRLAFQLKAGAISDYSQLGKILNQTLPATMLALIDKGAAYIDDLEKAIAALPAEAYEQTLIAMDSVQILAPIPKLRKNIFGIGLNYTEHIAESARALDTAKELPQKCVIFTKPPTAVIASGDQIRLNKNVTQQLDFEGELAVVIGKTGFRIKTETAMDHVWGYTIINDVSARDCRRSGQWIVSKGQDTFAPMGPVLVTKASITTPHNLQIVTKVNNVEKQNGNTRNMLFNIPAIIADISAVMTLEPGDIIATGTPAGVGAGRKPQEWLSPGDTIEISISEIGTLKNTVVDDTHA